MSLVFNTPTKSCCGKIESECSCKVTNPFSPGYKPDPITNDQGTFRPEGGALGLPVWNFGSAAEPTPAPFYGPMGLPVYDYDSRLKDPARDGLTYERFTPSTVPTVAPSQGGGAVTNDDAYLCEEDPRGTLNGGLVLNRQGAPRPAGGALGLPVWID